MRKAPVQSLLIVVIVALLLAVPVVFAQTNTFRVLSVDEVGCYSGDFEMSVVADVLTDGNTIVHTVVTAGGLIYMNEAAAMLITGTQGWGLYTSFSAGPVPNPGTFPIPAGQEMRLDFTVERPFGTVLDRWTLIVDGCNTGNILFNGPTPVVPVPPPTSDDACELAIPANSVVGDAPAGAQVYYEPGKESPGIVLNPGTYIVTGQDESETYYQVVLACQLIWVRKDMMGPSLLPPQSGAPLPTTIVH